MQKFIEDNEENIFSIQVKEVSNSITFVLDDFEFTFDSETSILQTKEEYLEPIIKKVNEKKLKDIVEILKRSIYAEEMDEEKPLYVGQDVFEDENDNHDIKFEDRLRLTEDTFHSDLFIHVFKFLDPLFIASLSRVSKKWNKITKLDVLWREFCKKESIFELSDLNEKWIDEYKDNLLFAIPKEIPKEIDNTNLIIDNFKKYSGNSLFVKVTNDTNQTLNPFQFNPNFFIKFICKENDSTFSYNLNYGNITIIKQALSIKYHSVNPKDGDIIGSVYNKITGEVYFTHNDVNLGTVLKIEKGMSFYIKVGNHISNYIMTPVKGFYTKKKLDFTPRDIKLKVKNEQIQINSFQNIVPIQQKFGIQQLFQ